MKSRREKPFYSSKQDLKRLQENKREKAFESKTYQLAFDDHDFLLREELRPVRLQLELLKPELTMLDEGVEATVVFFGSARTPSPETAEKFYQETETALQKQPNDPKLQQQLQLAKTKIKHSRYYTESQKLGKIVGEYSIRKGEQHLFVTTGGGPGIMEAANRGTSEAKARSLALGIIIPHEQIPNQYVTPDLAFPFHYFAIRKMHFLIRAIACIAFPGGFGTLDEIFDTLTLMQTKKMQPIPLVFFNREYWENIVNFYALVDEGMINEEDLQLFHFVETAEEAWEHILPHLQEQGY